MIMVRLASHRIPASTTQAQRLQVDQLHARLSAVPRLPMGVFQVHDLGQSMCRAPTIQAQPFYVVALLPVALPQPTALPLLVEAMARLKVLHQWEA